MMTLEIITNITDQQIAALGSACVRHCKKKNYNLDQAGDFICEALAEFCRLNARSRSEQEHWYDLVEQEIIKVYPELEYT